MSNSTADPEVRKEIRYTTRFLSQLFNIQLLFADAIPERRGAVRTLMARVLRYKISEPLRERFIRDIRMRLGSMVDVSAVLEEEQHRKLESTLGRFRTEERHRFSASTRTRISDRETTPNAKFDKQLAGIREEFSHDVAAATVLHHFETLVNYIECCFSVSHDWGCEEIFATIRFIVERGKHPDGEMSLLGISLLWVLGCQYGHIIPVARYASELKDQQI